MLKSAAFALVMSDLEKLAQDREERIFEKEPELEAQIEIFGR